MQFISLDSFDTRTEIHIVPNAIVHITPNSDNDNIDTVLLQENGKSYRIDGSYAEIKSLLPGFIEIDDCSDRRLSIAAPIKKYLINPALVNQAKKTPEGSVANFEIHLANGKMLISDVNPIK